MSDMHNEQTSDRVWRLSGVHFPQSERELLRNNATDESPMVKWPTEADAPIVVAVPENREWDAAICYPFLAACLALARTRGESTVTFDHNGPRERALPVPITDPARLHAARRRLWILREVALGLKSTPKVHYAALVNEIIETVHDPRFLFVQSRMHNMIPVRLSSGPDLGSPSSRFDRTRDARFSPNAYVVDLETLATYAPSDSGWLPVTNVIEIWLLCPTCGSETVATAEIVRTTQAGNWAQRGTARVFQPIDVPGVLRETPAADSERSCVCIQCGWIGAAEQLVPAYDWQLPASRA